MPRKTFTLPVLLACSLVVPAVPISSLASPNGTALSQDQDKKDKREIGSDKKTGSPTQKDRDTMNDIHKGSNDLKDKTAKEKKDRDKAKSKDKSKN